MGSLHLGGVMTGKRAFGVVFNGPLSAVSALVSVAAVMFAWFAWSWVGSDSKTDAADRVGAVVAVVGLVAAVGAVIVALLTIHQQRVENRRQRQMETLHLVNEQYENIFDGIYELRARVANPSEFDANDVRRAYNRFFTSLMTGYRYYRLDLIPREDFQEWTATLIGRFVEKECIVRAAPTEPCALTEQWIEFDSWARGPRTAFRAYMKAVRDEAEATLKLPEAQRKPAIVEAAKRVVDAIPPSE